MTRATFHSVGLLSVCVFLSLVGCKPATETPVAFEPNYLYAYRLKVSEDVPTDQYLDDAKELLSDWFGTPDAPKLPPLFAGKEYADLVSLEKMKMAVGSAPDGTEPSDHGLYRQLCVSCHGETGQGRGTVAASQNPYPRDFRKGVFKFKSTLRASKPLKSDIVRTLKEGLAGSQMPVFDKLTDDQINALVEYVTYLSIRGDFERRLLGMAVADLDAEHLYDEDPADRERLYDISYRDSKDDAKQKAFNDEVESATDLLTEIADSWVEAEDDNQEIDLPDSIPVIGATPTDEIDKDELMESIAKGRDVFRNQIAACSKCHGESANGIGQQAPDYDEWTKDWTTQIDIDPKNTQAILPFLARGGLKPQPLMPRNLIEGKLRGGRDPIAIYKKILYGIAGGPMPAAAMSSKPDQPGLSTDDVWNIVNYILSLSMPEYQLTQADPKVAAKLP